MNAQQRRAQLRAKPVYAPPAEHEAGDEDTERPDAHVYQVKRAQCVCVRLLRQLNDIYQGTQPDNGGNHHA